MTYQDYLKTDYWKQVSEAVKAKAGYRCQVCNRPDQLQAHHRSYAHRGQELEFLNDLTCLCDHCHGLYHEPAIVKKPAPPPVEMVLITGANCQRLRCTKEPWHWMHSIGINPKKRGWKQRAIGHSVPKHWLRLS